MKVDHLIIGQGLSGSMLGWFLKKEGRSFVIIDDESPYPASRVAAGIINPVTGRRYVSTWMIDELIPFCSSLYFELENFFDNRFVRKTGLIEFFTTPQMVEAFATRLTENDTWLHSYPDQNSFNPFFNYDFGCGQISPLLQVDVPLLLLHFKKLFQQESLLLNESFNISELKLEKELVSYRHITAGNIIFCDGVSSASNPYFELLPFAPNKGEMMIVRASELPGDHVYKKGMMLVPLPEKDLYWLGSNYQWEFEDDQPSMNFRRQAETLLKGWLKTDFEIIEHKAAVRPATLERRPFVGFHPVFKNVGILNGMGTKGASLAPFFAQMLTQHMVNGFSILPEAAVDRFHRVLSK